MNDISKKLKELYLKDKQLGKDRELVFKEIEKIRSEMSLEEKANFDMDNEDLWKIK